MFQIAIRTLFWIFISGIAIVIACRIYILLSTQKSITTKENSPSIPVAIVFGAGLRRDGTPTLVLRDRVETAVDLYKTGKVQKILMSGDNRFIEYNEPAAMKEYAISLGIPGEDIVLDYAGRRTYDTCYRAKHIFGLDKAILITQAFHLPRAVYHCRLIGLESSGVIANNAVYRKSSYLIWNIREAFASAVALWEGHIVHPKPVLGDTEFIFPK